MGAHEEKPAMHVPRMDAILSRWFTTYEAARASREAEGGYLLPYRHHDERGDPGVGAGP